MRSPFQYLSLLTATLLLSLTSPLQLPGTPLGIPGAMAAKSAKDSKVEAEKLPVKSFPRFNGELFQIAGSLGTGFKIKLSPTELRKELETLQQALVTQRKNGDRTGEAETLNQMGTIYVQLRDYSNALNLHQQALAIYEKLSTEQSAAETVGYIGNAYFKSGQYTLVEKLFRQKL